MRTRAGALAFRAVLMSAFLGIGHFALAADPPPIEAYGMLPTIENPRLSPDGSMMAFLSSADGHRCLRVHYLDDPKHIPKLICPGSYEVRNFMWKTNSRLLVGVYENELFRGSRLVTHSTLIATDADGENGKLLVKPRQGIFINFDTDRVLDYLEDDPEHILMLASVLSGLYPDILKVNVNTGENETLQGYRENVYFWITDDKGRPRLGASIVDKKVKYVYQGEAGGDFMPVDGNDVIGETGFAPQGFSDRPDVLYVTSNHETGRKCVYLYNVKSKTVVDRYACEAGFDIEGLIWRQKHVIGYYYSDDTSHQVFTDPAWKHDAELIAKQLPESRIALIDRTADGHRVLAEVMTGNQPPSFYILARAPGKPTSLSPVGDAQLYIPDEAVAPVKSVVYRARDGLQIHGYLTMPLGKHSGPIPFVVLPHGGPYARDYLGFDFIAQMIASRGYGVLQPNFRGSTGYGDAFLMAGFQEWGRKMQDDVTDGTKWLIDQKLADPSRICIVGLSYGGYAALMGVVREPALYKCAASMAGVTDLKHIQPASNARITNIALPALNGDKSLIDENSPARNAAKMNVPILLVHGREDVNVSVQDSIEMEKELRGAGKNVEALYFDGEDHFLFKEGDRVAFIKKLDEFLRANLGNPAN